MRIHQEQTEIYGNAVDQSAGFKILASAKAFKILSSSLYKYKQRAIIRELCCNAVDGHIALARTGAEVRDTFDVTIPSMLNQQFSVRDYGIGLCEEDVTGLYSTYFASTKSNSNDEIGGFGLGSKSPFAYTDTFTVTSWHGGMKRIFSAFMKNGEPQIMKMFETESNEPTGVEVTVPVGNDMNIWEQEAHRVFASFEKYRPKFIGKPLNISYMKFDQSGIYQVEVNRYGSNGLHASGVYAVMGGVVYPIPSEYWNNTMIGLYASNRAYYVRFEIGELDMTPSREELSLDPDTIASVEKRMMILNKSHDEQIDKIFASAEDIRDLYQKMRTLPDAVWSRMVENRDFKGKTIKQWKAHLSGYSRPNQDVFNMIVSIGAQARKNKIRYQNDCIGIQNSMPRVVINDLKTGAGEVLMGLHRLSKFRVDGAMIFDVANETLIDKKDPSKGTVGEAHRQNMENFLSYWPARMKTNNLVLLSKVRADVLKEMKDKGLVEVKKRTGKATNVVKIENGIASNVQMFAEDIDELKDCIWIATEWSQYRVVVPVVETETLKNGKTKEKVTDWKVNASHGEHIVRSWSMAEKKTIYVFAKTHWNRAFKNKNITHFDNEMVKQSVIKFAETINETHFGVSVSETWLNRMLNHPTTKTIVDGLCNSNGKFSEIGDFITKVVDTYAALGVKSHQDKALAQVVRELRKKATDIAYEKVRKFEKDNPLIVAYVNTTYSIKDSIATDIKRVAIV